MASCEVRTGVFTIIKANTLSKRVYQLSHVNNRDSTHGLKRYVKYTTLPSHIGILMNLFIVYTQRLLLVLNTYYLFIMCCPEIAHGTAAAIDKILTLKTNRRLR